MEDSPVIRTIADAPFIREIGEVGMGVKGLHGGGFGVGSHAEAIE